MTTKREARSASVENVAGSQHHSIGSVLFPAAVALGVCCCDENSQSPSRSFEIGVWEWNGDAGTPDFRPLREGDFIPGYLFEGGFAGWPIALRGADIDPETPETMASFRFRGDVVAAGVDSRRGEIEGSTVVVREVRVIGSWEGCCFVCRTGQLTAEVNARDGGRLSRSLEVVLEPVDSQCSDRPTWCCPAEWNVGCADPVLCE